MLPWAIDVLVIAAALLLGGCGRDSTANTAPPVPLPPVPVYVAPPVVGTGTIRGQILLVGTPPEMKVVAQGCHPGAPAVYDEAVVVGPHGGLANVIVYLKDVPAVPLPENYPPIILDQLNCRFQPHVMALRVGQTLRVHNGDDTPHNVLIESLVSKPQNLNQLPGNINDVVFTAPEAPMFIHCGVHQWMSAWIGVFDHPYFAVTGPDGNFEITNVPPGKYKLDAWHDELVTQEQSITVSSAKPTLVNFNFPAP